MSRISRSRSVAVALAACLTAAGMFVGAAPALAADGPTGSARMSGPANYCTTDWVDEGGDTVTYDGAFTAGAKFISASIEERDASDSVIVVEERQPNGTIIRRSPMPLTSANGRITVDEALGTFSGSSILRRLEDGTTATQKVTDHIVMTITLELGGVRTTLESNQIFVDSKPPNITGFKTRTTKDVEVVFSEPVFNDKGDAASDWTVDGTPATSVSAPAPVSEKRSIHLDLGELTEDQEPVVDYAPSIGPVGSTRDVYRDCVRHILLNDGTRTQSAIDETPPRIPRISQIDGKDATDDLVASRNAAPMIAIDQVTNGHTADVYLESDGTTGLQPATDTKLNPQPIVAASGATFQLPALGGDGERTFCTRPRPTPTATRAWTRTTGPSATTTRPTASIP